MSEDVPASDRIPWSPKRQKKSNITAAMRPAFILDGSLSLELDLKEFERIHTSDCMEAGTYRMARMVKASSAQHRQSCRTSPVMHPERRPRNVNFVMVAALVATFALAPTSTFAAPQGAGAAKSAASVVSAVTSAPAAAQPATSTAAAITNPNSASAAPQTAVISSQNQPQAAAPATSSNRPQSLPNDVPAVTQAPPPLQTNVVPVDSSTAAAASATSFVFVALPPGQRDTNPPPTAIPTQTASTGSATPSKSASQPTDTASSQNSSSGGGGGGLSGKTIGLIVSGIFGAILLLAGGSFIWTRYQDWTRKKGSKSLDDLAATNPRPNKQPLVGPDPTSGVSPVSKTPTSPTYNGAPSPRRVPPNAIANLSAPPNAVANNSRPNMPGPGPIGPPMGGYIDPDRPPSPTPSITPSMSASMVAARNTVYSITPSMSASQVGARRQEPMPPMPPMPQGGYYGGGGDGYQMGYGGYGGGAPAPRGPGNPGMSRPYGNGYDQRYQGYTPAPNPMPSPGHVAYAQINPQSQHYAEHYAPPRGGGYSPPRGQGPMGGRY
ncbi:hypothetical protein HDU96_003680 [Phlyctochytrium bullatum]|nr:hypothetical protein HDU96_003680 [Phlyctochytrium bullatum]